MTHRPLRALCLGALALVACSSSPGGAPSPSDRTSDSPAPADAVSAIVVHRDARATISSRLGTGGVANAGAGIPTFAWLTAKEGVRFRDAKEAAESSLRGAVRAFGLDDAAGASFGEAQIDAVSDGPIVARFKQRAGGVEIFRGGMAVALRRTFQPVAASGFAARTLVGASRPFTREARAALDDAYQAMVPGGSLPFTHLDTESDYQRWAAPGLGQPARLKKVLFPHEVDLEPAWYVELEMKRGRAWSMVVSAVDGRILFTNDLVRYDAYSYKVFADPVTQLPYDGPQGNGMAPYPSAGPSGVKPVWTTSQVVSLQNFPFSTNDPWLPTSATTLNGNNVRAYPDSAEPDGPTGDLSVALTDTNAFDHTYDTALSPGANPTNAQASATHLFYVTNFMHDWFYDAGFDEKSGNHQTDNLGRGGIGRDALRAEAQDFSGRNNANALVPSDGAAPQIQMFVFSGASEADLTVVTPAGIAGKKSVGLAGFGDDAFDLDGTVVVGNDDQGTDALDACESLSNNVAGKIVLVHRGLCSFIQKAQNVEAAGGIGAIIANVASSAQANVAPFMGGAGSNVNVHIPVLSLNLSDGQALEGAAATGATVSMHRALQTDLDGALDTTIVAHEWGHILSGRLVGDGNGLSTNQSGGLGEGWGDFTALLLTARKDDLLSPAGANWTGAYQNGAYATAGGGADFYYGIRRLPYSVDFAKNALTFKHIANGAALPATNAVSYGEDGSFNAEVHATGEVWATMLWECYVGLLRDPRYTFEQAQDRMKKYLVAGLKLTPIDPTLLEARDAILAAALAVDEADYKVLWEAFGRRGAGVGAIGPAKDSTNNQGVKESFFVGNDVQIVGAAITDDIISCDHDGVLDEGEVGTLTFTVRNSGPGSLAEPTAKLSSVVPGVKFLEGDLVKLAPLKPFASTDVKIKTQITAAEAAKPLAIDVAVGDPSFGDGRTQRLEVTARYGADEAAESSTLDRFDTKGTSWRVGAVDSTNLTKKWTRVMDGLEGRWVVPDVNEPVEHMLASPVFTIEGTTFELAFKHKWSFRFSTRRQVDVDGGVVEVSVDNGATWKDASQFGVVDYNTTLDDSRGDNALGGRKAYGNKSAGYPDKWISSRMALDLGAHPETVRVRFRVGSSTGFSGAPGWEIEEVELFGISSTPFWSFVPHADQCDPNGPTVTVGPAQIAKPRATVTLEGSGTHPAGLPLTFSWTQVAGPPVEVKNDGSPRLGIVAPDTTAPVTLTFALRANDGALLSPAARVDVSVTAPDATGLDAEGNGCGCVAAGVPSHGRAAGLTTLSILAASLLWRRRRSLVSSRV